MSHLIAGPFCTMLMADNGADVIKVEPPGGDIARSRQPYRYNRESGCATAGRDSVSAYFLAVNRGKRSMVVDLKTEQGRSVFDALLATADVVVENFRPGVLSRLGLDVDQIMTRHPRLVFASLSAYGSTGVSEDARNRPGVAIMAEAVGGLTTMARDREGDPVWLGFPLGDFTGGLVMHGAILSALLQLARTGAGARLDLAMAEAALALSGITLAAYAIEGTTHEGPFAHPFGVFPADDGHVVIGVNSDPFWQRLCEAMGRAELGTDERYATHPARVARARETENIVRSWTVQHPAATIVKLLSAAGVPSAAVADAAAVLANPEFASREALWDVADGLGGFVRLPANPMRLVSRPPTAVPRLGEHTAEVLAELGLDEVGSRRMSDVEA
jgi:CoA:oxalate CoA-transferase